LEKGLAHNKRDTFFFWVLPELSVSLLLDVVISVEIMLYGALFKGKPSSGFGHTDDVVISTTWLS
jgi:hypothetical protein